MNNGAHYVDNAAGNSPLHWAIQNLQLEAATYLIEAFSSIIDVLHQNSFGKCCLTEAIGTNNEAIISVCLNHQSASEDKLESTCVEVEDETSEPSVVHNFALKPGNLLQIRECQILPDEDVIGDEIDQTGLVVWPVSILLSRYLLNDSIQIIKQSDRVLELGSGCGVIGLSLCQQHHCQVTCSDHFEATLSNLRHNIQVNNQPIQVMNINWYDVNSWPCVSSFDVVVGCELVYSDSNEVNNASQQTSQLAHHALVENGLLIISIASEERAGTADLVSNVTANGFDLIQQSELGLDESDWNNPLADDADGEKLLKYFTEFSLRPRSKVYQFRKGFSLASSGQPSKTEVVV